MTFLFIFLGFFFQSVSNLSQNYTSRVIINFCSGTPECSWRAYLKSCIFDLWQTVNHCGCTELNRVLDFIVTVKKGSIIAKGKAFALV